MGKQSFISKVREWIGGLAFKIFLWSIRMTQDEYLDSVALRKRAEYCLCAISVLHENNICVNCGLPYKHSMAEKDKPFILTDMPRPWSEGGMKKCPACSGVGHFLVGDVDEACEWCEGTGLA